jgi:hypothetical protein
LGSRLKLGCNIVNESLSSSFSFSLATCGVSIFGVFGVFHAFFLSKEKEITSAFEIYSYIPRQRRQNVGHYNFLINFKQPSET